MYIYHCSLLIKHIWSLKNDKKKEAKKWKTLSFFSMTSEAESNCKKKANKRFYASL